MRARGVCGVTAGVCLLVSALTALTALPANAETRAVVGPARGSVSSATPAGVVWSVSTTRLVSSTTPARVSSAAPARVSLAAPARVSIDLDRASVAVRAGDRFSFQSTLHNDSDQPMTDLVVHLSITSIDPAVYVDPEDWSSRRSQYVGQLAPGASRVLRWDVRAVGAGQFVLFVSAALPSADAGVSGSVPLRLEVTQRRVLSAGSVVPVAAAVPAVILLLMAGVTRWRRRLR